MKLRQSKKMCKRYIDDSNLKIIKTIKHLFIVAAKPNFMCSRWYAFTISAENNPRLQELIEEQKCLQ